MKSSGFQPELISQMCMVQYMVVSVQYTVGVFVGTDLTIIKRTSPPQTKRHSSGNSERETGPLSLKLLVNQVYEPLVFFLNY